MRFILGMIFGAAFMWLAFWLEARKIAVRLYEWAIGALGFMLAVWAVHDFFASMSEYNEFAGRTLLWILGIPALIFMALAVFLPWRRMHPVKTKAAEKAGV